MEGFPGGWSGKPAKTIPFTSLISCLEKYWEVMRPPKDLPPANSGVEGNDSTAF
jgi:hypothetical protein